MTRKFASLLILSLLLSMEVARAETDLIGLYLTWQRDPTTTMTVNWVNLYKHTPTKVWYRPSGGELWKSETGRRHEVTPSTLQARRVELTRLKPDTMYEFSIGDEPSKDGKGLQRFRTMPAEMNRPIRFVNGGDMMHTREFLDEMNRQAAKLDPDFAFLGGDYAYANGLYASRWIDWFESWTTLMRGKDGRLIPLVAAIGNHEVRGHYDGRIPKDSPYYYGFFALPENRSYHVLDFGRYLSLIILDSGHTQPISGKQTEWLNKTLEKRAEQQFVFPAYHWPVYGTTKAPKGSLPNEHPRSLEIRTNWVSKFEQYGVSAVFEHDHHTYKRTHRLLNNQRNDENGILYLGDGAWGVNTRPAVSVKEAWYLAKSESRRHLHHVTLHPNGRITVEAVDGKGEVFDRTTLQDARNKPVPLDGRNVQNR